MDLLYFGPGHTDGDAVVYFPDEKDLGPLATKYLFISWFSRKTHSARLKDVLTLAAVR